MMMMMSASGTYEYYKLELIIFNGVTAVWACMESASWMV